MRIYFSELISKCESKGHLIIRTSNGYKIVAKTDDPYPVTIVIHKTQIEHVVPQCTLEVFIKNYQLESVI